MTIDADLHKEITEMLLATAEKADEKGIGVAEFAGMVAIFLTDLVFDTAPTPQHGVHLILSAINWRMEAEMEGRVGGEEGGTAK